MDFYVYIYIYMYKFKYANQSHVIIFHNSDIFVPFYLEYSE